MRNSILCILLLVFSLASKAGAEGECSHTKNRLNCVKYKRNYDGDTITVDIPGTHSLFGKGVSVRVRGVDTPEVKTNNRCEKEVGRIARKLVASLLKNSKRIDLVNVERGKYFRIVADVVFDGRDLASVLLSQSLAYKYDGGKKEHPNWCEVKRLPSSIK